MSEGCFYCGDSTVDVCTCGTIYCTAHLHIHRPGDYCLPFKVARSDEVGRYLVATRDIQPLELVLWDKAAAIGPGADTLPVCVECLVRLKENFINCPGCHLPLCSAECIGGVLHRDECNIFSKLDRRPHLPSINEKHPVYSTIAPLRLLFLKKTNPDLWSRVTSLMDHNQDRFESDPETVGMFDLIVKFFLEELMLDFCTVDEILHLIGVLMTNGFENDHEGTSGRALYPTLSLASHSCSANLRHAISPGKQVALQAQVHIKKGEELTIRYTHMLQPVLKRRRQIRDVWYFDCSCPRCSDPTEFGTNASAVSCPSCHSGKLLPENSLNSTSPWICSKCKETKAATYIEELEERAEKDLEDIKDQEIPNYQAFLEKYKSLLSPSNCYIVIAKRYIQAILGNSEGLELDKLSITELEDKIRFYRTFLRYLGKLDPGYSQHAALATLEMSKAEVELYRRQVESGLGDKNELTKFIKQQLHVQTQAHRCLKKVKLEKSLRI